MEVSEMTQLYVRTIHDDSGTTTQYLETREGEAWLGWEIYDNDNVSDILPIVGLDAIPAGYEPCHD
jgi:hypothetical protein